MTNLPEQAHGNSVATVGTQEAYAIDQSMVKLPSLYLAQYSSKAFKARTVGFGDIYVGLGADDPTPTVVGKGPDDPTAGLSEAVRFYIHTAAPMYQVVDKTANYGKRSLRVGTTFAQALAEAGGDPRNVFLQTSFSLTVPAFPLLPVRFIMGSRWGGNAARWINTQISLALMQDKRVLDIPFQIQTRPTSNDSGDYFVDAVVGFAKVAAKDARADQEIVESHTALATAPPIDNTTDDAYASAEASEAPSLA